MLISPMRWLSDVILSTGLIFRPTLSVLANEPSPNLSAAELSSKLFPALP